MLKQLISIATLSQSVNKPEFIILHVGTNNVRFRKSTGNIYSFLRLKNTILNTLPSYTIVFSEPTSRTDNVKETLILWHLTEHLRQLNIGIIDSSNIKDVNIGLKGLHLNAKWICRPVINFMRKICMLWWIWEHVNELAEPCTSDTIFSNLTSAVNFESTKVLKDTNCQNQEYENNVSSSTNLNSMTM